MRRCAVLLLLVLLSGFAAGLVSAADNAVTIRVVDADVRDVFTALASVGKVNIVADDSVTGKVTLDLVDVPFATALNIVVKTKGPAYHQAGNIIIVAAPDKLAKGFGSTHVIKLDYAKAEDVKKALSASIAAERLKVDDATNAIVFFGAESELNQLKAVLANLDVPYQQISLEAEVVAISKNAAKDLGIDWKWDATPTYAEYTDPVYTPVYDSNGRIVNSILTTPGKVTRPNATGVIQYGRNPEGYPYEFRYQAQISALVSNDKAKILAKPNIKTINGQEASILIGDRIPVLVTTLQNGQTINTINYVDAGIKLKYTPRINADGQITATVHTEVSTPTLVSEMKAYRITTRQATTNIRMKDGETIVIGGLIGAEESGGKNRVPGLADLPILGKLFESVHTTKSETELMIFLTARIAKDGKAGNADKADKAQKDDAARISD